MQEWYLNYSGLNVSVLQLSHSKPDLLSISRDPRFQTLKLSAFVTCLASLRHHNHIYEKIR